jgi:hypothetical protein
LIARVETGTRRSKKLTRYLEGTSAVRYTLNITPIDSENQTMSNTPCARCREITSQLVSVSVDDVSKALQFQGSIESESVVNVFRNILSKISTSTFYVNYLLSQTPRKKEYISIV